MTFLQMPYVKLHLWIAGILTLLIMVVVYCFSVEGYNEVISHPQFPNVENFDQIIQFFKDNKIDLTWYHCFFILDFLWAPTLLLLLFRIVMYKGDGMGVKLSVYSWLMLLFMMLAWASDVTENIGYLTEKNKLLDLSIKAIVDIKKSMYAVVILLFLIFLYQQFVASQLRNIRFAIKVTRFSLLIILLLLLLSTGMDQGSTVIVHLLQHPWSIIGTIIFLNVLALACAHYPDYIEKNLTGGDTITWDMKPKWMKEKLGVGFILYSFSASQHIFPDAAKAPERQSKTNTSAFLENFRKNLGSLLWLTWIYVLLFMYKKYAEPDLPLTNIMIAFTVLFGFFFRMAYIAKKKWEIYFASRKEEFMAKANLEDVHEREMELRKLIKAGRFEKFLIITLLSFLLLILFTIVTACFALHQDWEITGRFLLMASFFSLIFFVFFQHFRKIFSYYIPPWYLRWIWVHRLNNDLTYIQFFAAMGWIGFLTVVCTTSQPSSVNTLLLILIFFYLYYGFFIVLLKHHIFYNSPKEGSTFNHWTGFLGKFFKTYAPILPLVLLIWMLFTAKTGNGLHVLWPVSENSSRVDLDDYLNRFSSGQDSLPQNHYFLASYGGGLRASVWTMLLLDHVEEYDSNFFNSTVAMSGVSGGFVGLAMYNAIRTEYTDPAIRSAKVDTIGQHNILSIEVSYLMGADFIRELEPYRDSFNCPDRARRSMQEYASLIQPDSALRNNLSKLSFRDYWEKGNDTVSKTFNPALIGNTTGTYGRYGVAFSVVPKDFEVVFPGATDILTVGERSIQYLDATSTTERFPLFSPTAQIQKKGSFLDGGYFENSGLLSLMNLYAYVEKKKPELVKPESTKVLLIINSKEAYIRHVLLDTFIPKKELATGELGAILSTVANTDILPMALESRVKNEFGNNFIRIYLPYPIRYSDVVDLIRGTPEDPLDIQKKINASNVLINKVWNEYTCYSGEIKVPPALARVLSDPAFEYIKAMLNHPEVQEALKQIR